MPAKILGINVEELLYSMELSLNMAISSKEMAVVDKSY